MQSVCCKSIWIALFVLPVIVDFRIPKKRLLKGISIGTKIFSGSYRPYHRRPRGKALCVCFGKNIQHAPPKAAELPNVPNAHHTNSLHLATQE